METLKWCEEWNNRARAARLIATQVRQHLQDFKENMWANDVRKYTPMKKVFIEKLAHEEDPHMDTSVKLQHVVISKPTTFDQLSDTFNGNSSKNVGGNSTYVYLEHTEDIDGIKRYEQIGLVG